jgi:single-stranded DNA-binding protein
MDINETLIVGTVVEDPKVYTFERNGREKRVANFTVLTEIPTTGSFTVKTFHRCTGWEGLAEAASKLRDGDRVYVKGIYKSRSYEKDGVKRRTMEIDVEQITSPSQAFAAGPSESSSPAPQAPSPKAPPAPTGPPGTSGPWPFRDARGIAWTAPPDNDGMSYVTSPDGGELSCVWTDPTDPGKGGKIYRWESEEWVEWSVSVASDDDIPF